MNTVNIKFELPTIVTSLAGLDTENISHDVKRMFSMFLYEHKLVTLSKACEIGGMSQWMFYEMNNRLGIPIHYTKKKLMEDMERLADV